jgi:hypothetical protein
MTRAILLLSLLAGAASADSGKLFVASAVEHPDGTVTLPLYKGTSGGQTVWYVIIDSSDGADAQAKGLNHSQKLANARGTAAAQRVTLNGGVVDFPGTVDFAFGTRTVVPGPAGFPPAAATPAAKGDALYSPLIQLPNGIVENAPQLINDSGRAAKVKAVDFVRMTVTVEETTGFSGGNPVRYFSSESSNPVGATLESSTWAPLLDNAPSLDNDGTGSARASLAAFANGQTGANNPERQGLNSAILDGLSPLNVLRWAPNQGRYSPLWDVHIAAFAKGVAPTRQEDYGDVINLASKGKLTAPDGTPFAASGFIVVCPIISSQ